MDLRSPAPNRLPQLLLVGVLMAALSAPPGFAEPPGAPAASPQPAATQRDGQHDFDFEIGTWKTHLKRLLNPLTGSTTWAEYHGTTVVRKVWDGRANLVELVAEGPAGRFEGLSLRLYNPQSRQWSLNFASSRSGTLSPPAIGEFKNGRGEFYSQETLNGRAILVRFVISDITPESCRFEQAFSDDGGRTWEVNWIAVDTRVGAEVKEGLAPDAGQDGGEKGEGPVRQGAGTGPFPALPRSRRGGPPPPADRREPLKDFDRSGSRLRFARRATGCGLPRALHVRRLTAPSE